MFALSRTALIFWLMIRCFLTTVELYVNASWLLMSSEVVSSGFEPISWLVKCFLVQRIVTIQNLLVFRPTALLARLVRNLSPRYSQYDLSAAEPGTACPLQTELSSLREHELCQTVNLVWLSTLPGFSCLTDCYAACFSKALVVACRVLYFIDDISLGFHWNPALVSYLN